MKKLNSNVTYETKGMLTNYAGGVLETMNAKEVVDEIDFNDLLIELKSFCDENIEKDVVVKFSATATE